MHTSGTPAMETVPARTTSQTWSDRFRGRQVKELLCHLQQLHPTKSVSCLAQRSQIGRLESSVGRIQRCRRESVAGIAHILSSMLEDVVAWMARHSFERCIRKRFEEPVQWVEPPTHSLIQLDHPSVLNPREGPPDQPVSS